MYNFKESEEEILKFWQQKKIYEKAKEKNKKGKKFYMMDGPPYANGHIHMGHALNKILKDIAMRSRRLQGFNVFDLAGYDTHGVPIEFQIEKEIGSKTKKDIEKFGVKNFIDKCKEFAVKYVAVMNKEFKDIGIWMDFENAYVTFTDDYIETIWDTFKVADKKGLLYLGKYPIHICPRCETAVAYNEIEYAKQEDTSIFVKFPLKDEKNIFLVIWTTTPWTLPGNTAVMANPDIDYREVELPNGERWVIAKALVEKIMAEIGQEYTAKEEYKGKEMEGWEYENPLKKHLNLKLKNAYKVVLSRRYVNLEEGTGLVHCAPGHGKEDYDVGREYGLDMPSPVNISGVLTDEAGKYAGKKAIDANEEIIKDLEKDNFLIHKLKYTHDYPLCWRCKSPLLMVSQPQWFLKISSIQENLLKHNDSTAWTPSWMKLRMKGWLEGISDWPVSRKRYWGTPLPIWICQKCEKKIVVGSVAELKKLSGKKKIELHKPEIDNIQIPCSCGAKMKRVEEVLDVWFDSGVSSWAALKYTKNKKLFEEFWPADLNVEGKDQVRGWWNSQLILSEIRFGKKPFNSILVHGMALDIGKKKMSKSLGNIISPQEIINVYGRDFLRYYFAKISKGEDFAFDEQEFSEIQKVLRILVNVNNLINQLENKKSKLRIEDKWILSRLNSAIKQVTESYNNFRFSDAIQTLEKFLVFDLSRSYIQSTRERAEQTYEILNKIMVDLLKLFAPLIPFTTEKIWQELKKRKIAKEESINLSNWPRVDEKTISKRLEMDMGIAQAIIEKILAKRAEAGIGIRWPLAKAVIQTKKENVEALKRMQEVICSQVNIKDLGFRIAKEEKIELDTKINSELEAEGYAREICRRVQDARKKGGLKKEQKIELVLQIAPDMQKLLQKRAEFLKERVNAFKLKLTGYDEKIKNYRFSEEAVIKDKKVKIGFNVLK